MPCVENNQLIDLKTGIGCNIRGGIQCAFYQRYDAIDWDAMALDAGAFDQTNQCINSYIAVADAEPWKCIEFERKTATYASTYTYDARVYETVINMNFRGKGKEIRNAFCQLIQSCRLVIHIFDNNCEERVFGVEWTGTDFLIDIEPFRVERHLDQGGLLGSTDPSDELDFGGESICPALYGGVGSKADFIANFT